MDVVTHTPPPHNGTGASPAVVGQEWTTFWIIIALLVGGAIGGAVTWVTVDRDRVTTFRWASFGGFVVGLAGAIGHSVFVDLRPDEKFVPNLDQTTLLWAAIAVASLLIPFISEFNFGGASVKLLETKDTADDVVESATDLTQNWTNQISQFLAELETGVTPEVFSASLRDFMKIRSYEALEWLSGDGEKRRLSLWLYDERLDELRISFADGITDRRTLDARIKNGTGIVGTIYKLQQTWNERDAPSLPVWIPIRSDSPPRYHGIFVTPVNYSDIRLGVLSVDRRKFERFSAAAEDVILALANVYGIVLGNEKSQALLSALETQIADAGERKV